MVTLIFVGVLVAAMTLDWLVMRRLEGVFGNRTTVDAEPAVEIIVPRTLFFHRGHSWARLDEDGTVTVGIDDLLRSLVGEVTTVELPAIGDHAEAGRPTVAVGRGDRLLRVPAPVSGRIIEVNRAIGRDPARLRWRPYKDGWTFRLRPGTRLADELAELVIGEDAARWMTAEIRRVDAMFREGVLERPVEGALGRAPEPAWATLQHELLPTDATPGQGP